MGCSLDFERINSSNLVVYPDEIPAFTQEYNRVWKVISVCCPSEWKIARDSFLELSEASRTWIDRQIHSLPVNYFLRDKNCCWKSETFYNLNDLDKAARELSKKIFDGLCHVKGCLNNMIIDKDVFFQTKFRILENVDAWVKQGPEGENRSHCREQIFFFINLSHNFVPYQLDFSNCRLTCLPDIFHFDFFIENLQILQLSGNQLKTLPDSISKLKKLKTISLESNPLESVPRSLLLLQGLRKLSLSLLPGDEKVNLSLEELLWASYWFSYEKPQGEQIPPLEILEMKNNFNPQEPNVNDFQPTEASSRKTSNRWDCLGEMTSPEGDQLFLFKFVEKRKDKFPAEEASEIWAKAVYEDENPYKYHFRALGFHFFQNKKNDENYLILPSIQSFLKRWQTLTEKGAKYLKLPALTACVSSKYFSDKKFINAFFNFDLAVSDNDRFLHDMCFHLTIQIYKIFENFSGYSIENQRLRNMLKKKKKQIDFIYVNKGLYNYLENGELLLKYKRPIITMLSVAIDKITSSCITSHINQNTIDELYFITKDQRWKKYFLNHFSNPQLQNNYVPEFNFDELVLAWKTLAKVQVTKIDFERLNRSELILNPEEIPFISLEYKNIWTVISACSSLNFQLARDSFSWLSEASKAWIHQQISSSQKESASYYNLNNLDMAARKLASKYFRGLMAIQGKEIPQIPADLELSPAEFQLLLEKNCVLEIVDAWVNENWIKSMEERTKGLHCREQIFQFINVNSQDHSFSGQLDLSNCSLTSLPDIFHFEIISKSLKDLSLFGNRLEYLPDSICKLRNLKNISMDLLQEIPHSLFFLPELSSLSLSNYRLSWDTLLWASYWFLYEKPQYKLIPIEEIFKMMGSLKPQVPNVKDFHPTEASSKKSSNRWNCLGEMTTPTGQRIFLFKFIKNSNDIFPVQEPSPVDAFCSFGNRYHYAFHFQALGFRVFQDPETKEDYMILPSINSFINSWNAMTERCSRSLTLPRLTPCTSPKSFSDLEFIDGFFNYNISISDDDKFVHDMWFHLSYQIKRILEVAQKKTPVYKTENQRLRSLLQMKRDQINYIYNDLSRCKNPEMPKLFLKYQRPMITALSAAIDKLTSFIIISEIDRKHIDTLNLIFYDLEWKKYFLNRFSNPENREEYVPDFEFRELQQAWLALAEIQVN